MKRGLMIAGLAAAGLALVAFLGRGLLGVVQGEDDVGAPSTSRLLPVPEGTEVVVDRTWQGEGSLGVGQRLLVLGTSKVPTPASRVAATYLEGLRSRGWTSPQPSSALSPDTEICLTAEPMADYLADPERPERTKQLLRDLDRPVDSIAVITAIFC